MVGLKKDATLRSPATLLALGLALALPLDLVGTWLDHESSRLWLRISSVVLTFPLERRSRWAEPGLKGETERRGGSSPCSSSRLGIWESPHLSLDLGESPHPVS